MGLRGRVSLVLFGYFMVLQTAFRVAFFELFHATANHPATHDLVKAFFLGMRFDIRVALAACLPVLLFPWWINPFKTAQRRSLWAAFYALLSGFLVAFFLLDFGYFAYLHSRVNATVLHFLDNFMISAEMVWQTYPVIPGLVGLLIVLTGTFLGLRRWIFIEGSPVTLTKSHQWAVGLVMAFCFVVGAYGKISQYPLRWSEAFFSTDGFVSALALNPMHYFFDTLAHRDSDFDLQKVREHYTEMASYLGVEEPDAKTLNFTRPNHTTPLPHIEEDRPNVVFFIMESFAAYKTGFVGHHPLNPTPNFDEIAKNSLLFDRFYVPSEGTARSVFGYISGVADVTRHKTSSRNPLIVDQNTLVNAFNDYDKYYFIGGSASWGNIRGILSHNIPGVEIVEEGMFHHPRTDVWGIADNHLFEEAHERLAAHDSSKRPFFAFIQSAGFHRPYTIPEDHGKFELKTVSDEQIQHSGFISLAEYNSMRFADYSLGRFFELAKSAPYFKNTIFVIVGDHGLPDDNADHVAPAEKLHLLSRFHVPLVLYSPKYWPHGEVNHTLATSPDVLPTLAGLAGRPFLNSALGRNLFDPQFKDRRYAFTYVYYQTPPEIGLLTPHFFVSGTPGHVDQIFDMQSDHPEKDVKGMYPDEFKRLRSLADGFHETAKYLLYHNPNKLNKAAAVP
jgi:phosphoglycerol transferase MdoB-like AlkP superfamily enzyme